MLSMRDQARVREVIAGSQVVVVDFWAPWCSSCKVITRHLEGIEDAQEFPGHVFVQVNVEESDHHLTAGDLSVVGVPTLVLFRDGREVSRKTSTAGGLPGLRDFLRSGSPSDAGVP